MAETAHLHAFTARGVARGAAGRVDGQHHAMLILVASSATPEIGADAAAETAAETAVARVAAEGWAGVTILRRKAVTLDLDGIADETVRTAARAAWSDGCAFVVYTDPLPTDG